jgi:hypothetical protein
VSSVRTSWSGPPDPACLGAGALLPKGSTVATADVGAHGRGAPRPMTL